jgi:hypothetical protein
MRKLQKSKSDVDIGPAKKKSMGAGMSESDEESANMGAAPMLECISRELKRRSV